MSIFGKARKAWDWNRLGLRLSKVEGAMEKADAAQGYSPGTSLKKGLGAVGWAVLWAALTAVFEFGANQEAVAAVLNSAGIGASAAGTLGLVVVFVGKSGLNWLKNRER